MIFAAAYRDHIAEWKAAIESLLADESRRRDVGVSGAQRCGAVDLGEEGGEGDGKVRVIDGGF